MSAPSHPRPATGPTNGRADGATDPVTGLSTGVVAGGQGAGPDTLTSAPRSGAAPVVGVEDRGQLRIAETVVERIAATGAAEIVDVGGLARRVFGVAAGHDGPDRAPRVQADVTGTTCTVRVQLSVTYPAPVRTVTDTVRTHLAARVAELTGLQVRRVDLEVTALTSLVPASSSRRVS